LAPISSQASKDSGERLQATLRLVIVIVSWNTAQLLRQCLLTLKTELVRSGFSDSNCAVFVIDNDSSDGSAELVANEFPWAKLTANQRNVGFAAANNQALNMVSAEYILLLNPDTEVKAGALSTLIQFLDNHPKAAVVAPQLLNSDGSVQRSCRAFPSFSGMLFELLGLSRLMPSVKKFREYKMLDWEHDDERQVDQPEGACLLIRSTVFDQVGRLDEGYFMLFEEVDWCYSVKQAGWEIWFTPTAQVLHHYGQSIKQVKVKMILSSHRGLYRFWYKHYRNGRWYLDAFAYAGLMSLAYLRIAAHLFRRRA
jgi:GT2 family glycosyltransferase